MYGYHDHDQGSFAYYAVWKADYIFKIPDSIPREFAAPLVSSRCPRDSDSIASVLKPGLIHTSNVVVRLSTTLCDLLAPSPLTAWA